MLSKPKWLCAFLARRVGRSHALPTKVSRLSGTHQRISKIRYALFFIIPLIILSIGLLLGSELAHLVVTGFLYLALLFVNFDLKDIQRGQNELLERERRPLIEIASVDLGFEPCKFRVSNFGNGYATGLSVVVKTVIPSETEINGSTIWRNLTRGATKEYDRNEQTIPGDSECILLEGTPHIGLIDGTEQTMPATEATRVLSDRDIPRINFQLFLVYTSSIGEVGSIPVTKPRTVEINSEMTFQELYRQSHDLGGYELDTFSDFDLTEIIHTRDVEDLREPTLL